MVCFPDDFKGLVQGYLRLMDVFVRIGPLVDLQNVPRIYYGKSEKIIVT